MDATDNGPCQYKALCYSAHCNREHQNCHWRTELQKLQDSLIVDMHTVDFANSLHVLRTDVETYVLAQKLAHKLG